MSIYRIQPLGLDRVHTYPLRSRPSKVSVKDFARVPKPKATVREWVETLPGILAGESFRAVLDAIECARLKGKPIIWGMGGHVIKVGLAPVIIDLMKRGFITAVAMNGAAMIHDFEIALAGTTSEDVPAQLGRGQFGMAEETGRLLNKAITDGDAEELGVGESVGRLLSRTLPSRQVPYRRYSVLANAYRQGIPLTVHEAVGTDIIHCHPSTAPRALGAATYRDFRLLASMVRAMDRGGVYLNVGSAVILPEVFLKCFSLAANLGNAPRGITTVNMDFIQHYRPTQNVLLRPAAAGNGKGRDRSQGYALTGHHELMIPLLAAALAKPRKKR